MKLSQVCESSPVKISGGLKSLESLIDMITPNASPDQYDEMEAAILSQFKHKKVIWDNTKIVAAIAYGEVGPHVEIHHLGSASKGHGTTLVNSAKEFARKKKMNLVATVKPGAEGFYEKLGFKKLSHLLFSWTLNI